MYTDELVEKRRFPFRDFLLKLILVVVFVLLLVWLLPKFMAPVATPKVDLTPLTSQIFADNLKRMQDAATSYYTTERLPKEIGDKDTMTLRDMIAKNLIIPLIDKDGKVCDLDGSYVTITKLDTEYLMKVNLKCGDQEDYVLVHMGCYNYCDSFICAKRDEEVVNTPTKPPEPQKDTPTNPEPTPEYCPITSCAANQTLINPGSKDCYCKDDPIPEEKPNYEYEYQKWIGATYSKWDAWSNWTIYVDADGIQPISCEDSDPNCLKRIEVKQERKQVGTYPKSYLQAYQSEEPSLSYTETWCSEWSYEKYGNTVYAKKGGAWVDRGIFTYDNPPQDTPTTYYELVGSNYLACDDACQTLPKFTFRKWEYTGETVSVTDHPNIAVSCATKSTKKVTVYVTRYKTVQREEPAYADVKYYRIQTRKLLNQGKADIKWSYYNDTNLLNNGYKYTGNSRKK